MGDIPPDATAAKAPSKGLLAKVRGRDDARQAGLLVGGTMIAQVVALASTTILTRLFTPENFGVLGLMMSISTIGGAVSALCYEQALLQPRSERMARGLAALSFQLSFVGAILIFGLLAGIGYAAPDLFGQHVDIWFYLICAVGVWATTHFNLLGFIHSRAGRYKPVAISKINQTVLPTLAQIAFGFLRLAELGLVGGRAIGAVATNLWLQRTVPAGYQLKNLVVHDRKVMWAAARSYADHIINVPRQLLVRGSSSAPSILLLAGFGPLEAGLFFFAQRIIERPGMLLGDALLRVPLKQLTVRRSKGQKIARTVLGYTAVCAVPVFFGCALLAVAAKPLIPIVFGARWSAASDYLVVMAIWAGIRMTALPMSAVLGALRLQKINLVVDTIFAFRVLVIPLFASQGRSAIEAVAAFCALSVLYDLVIFALGLTYALKHDRQLKGAPAGG